MAQVEFRSVGKEFGGQSVLHDIDFQVPAGAFVALIGPSGCGKSTLLRMIAGLEHIDFGEIRIDGRGVNDLAPKDRDVAMVFQNYALYPHMTVAENMMFSLRMARIPRAEGSMRMMEAARILGLEEFLERFPRQLSGGQRQRVAMGRAIVRKPKVFLFDEPLSNLDAKLRVQMRAEVKRLHQQLGTTMIFVTHDQVEAMTMAEQVIILREGRVEQVGAPLELYDTPSNVFVAGFIGSPAMNLIRGAFEVSEGALNFIPQMGSPIRLPPNSLPGAGEIVQGRQYLLGLRPEHIELPGSSPASDRDETLAKIPAEVVLIEATGLDTHIVAAAEHGEIAILTRGRFDAKVGDRLLLHLILPNAHLFDAQSEARVG